MREPAHAFTSGPSLDRRWDVVIAGGGHNGLVAAAYLARAGLSVLVAERAGRLGGATHSAEVFPGVPANLSRYSYLVSLLPERIVEDLGLRIELRARSISACAPYRSGGSDRALVLSDADPAGTEASLRELAGPGAAGGLSELGRLERAFAARVFPSMLEPLRSRGQWLSELDGPLERAAWEWLVERPIGELIEREIASDLLRGLVLTDAKIGVLAGAHDRSLLQNRTFILHVIGRGDGRWLVPVGGMGALSAELTRAAGEAGAQLRTGVEVISAETADGAPGVTLTVRTAEAELELEAGHLLFCGGPAALAHVLGGESEPRAEDEGSVAKVNMVLSRLPRLRSGVDPAVAFAGTFRLGEGYGELGRSHREAASGRLPQRPPAELYCHTLTDDSILAPDLRRRGWQTLTLFGLDVPYGVCAADPDGVGRELWRRYVNQLDELLAEPFEDCIALDRDGAPCVEVVTAAGIESELGLEQGNIFANAPSWFFADGDEEPGSWGTATALPRVHRCGSTAARGGAVSGIPGHNAARAVLDELGIGPGA